MTSPAHETAAATTPTLPDATALGAIRLTVADLDTMRDFYARAIGLEVLAEEDGLVRLGAGGHALVELQGDPAAAPRAPRTTGLFHLALLVPSRAALAAAVRRVVEGGGRLGGASDHLVSEALYLRDPEGNGIELYRDRPRSEWAYTGDEVQMATIALDLDAVMAELPEERAPMPAGTRLGHVHLNVGDLRAAEDFYSGVLGFDVMVRGYPGALFVAAGGYHHHIGLNTWNGEGVPAPAPGSRGLAWFELALPPEAVAALVARARSAGVPVEERPGGPLLRDPFGTGVLVTKAPD